MLGRFGTEWRKKVQFKKRIVSIRTSGLFPRCQTQLRHNNNDPCAETKGYVEELNSNNEVMELLSEEFSSYNMKKVYPVRHSNNIGKEWGFTFTDAFGRTTKLRNCDSISNARNQLAETLCFYLSPNVTKYSANSTFPTFILENDFVLRQALEIKDSYSSEIEKTFLKNDSREKSISTYLRFKYNNKAAENAARVLSYKTRESLIQGNHPTSTDYVYSKWLNLYKSIETFLHVNNADIFYKINLYRQIINYAPEYDRVGYFVWLYNFLRPDLLSSQKKIRKIIWHSINIPMMDYDTFEEDVLFPREERSVIALMKLKHNIKRLEKLDSFIGNSINQNIDLLKMYRETLEAQPSPFVFSKSNLLNNRSLRVSAFTKRYAKAIAPTIFSLQITEPHSNVLENMSFLNQSKISGFEDSSHKKEDAEIIFTNIVESLKNFPFALAEVFVTIDSINRLFEEDFSLKSFDNLVRTLDNSLNLVSFSGYNNTFNDSEVLKYNLIDFVDSPIFERMLRFHQLRNVFVELIGIVAPHSISDFMPSHTRKELPQMRFPTPDIGIKNDFTEANAFLALRTFYFCLHENAKAEAELRAFMANENPAKLEDFLYNVKQKLNKKQIAQIISACRYYYHTQIDSGITNHQFMKMLSGYQKKVDDMFLVTRPHNKETKYLMAAIYRALDKDTSMYQQFRDCFHSLTAESLVSSYLTLQEVSPSLTNLTKLGVKLDRLKRPKKPIFFDVNIPELPSETYSILGLSPDSLKEKATKSIFLFNCPESLPPRFLEEVLKTYIGTNRVYEIVPENAHSLEKLKVLQEIQRELQTQFVNDILALLKEPVTKDVIHQLLLKATISWENCSEQLRESICEKEMEYIISLNLGSVDKEKGISELKRAISKLNELITKIHKEKKDIPFHASVTQFKEDCSRYKSFIEHTNWEVSLLNPKVKSKEEHEAYAKMLLTHLLLKCLPSMLRELNALLRSYIEKGHRLPNNPLMVVVGRKDEQMMQLAQEILDREVGDIRHSSQRAIGVYSAYSSTDKAHSMNQTSESLSQEKFLARVEFESEDVAKSVLAPITSHFGISLPIGKYTDPETYSTHIASVNAHKHKGKVLLNDFYPQEATDFTSLIVRGFPVTIRNSRQMEMYLRSFLPSSPLMELFTENLEQQLGRRVYGGTDRIILKIHLASHHDALCLKNYLEKYVPGIIVSW